jgi:acetolactate synthase-1/2/3 large subunit
MKMKGAEILLDCLEQQGVDVIFGYPGGTVLPIYDALYDRKKIKHVLTRHEQGAAHAADGYARATGKVGVCLATSGPGATNLVTGIATAHMDSVPMVALTGQVALSMLGRDSFQEADILGITLPLTKHSYLVKDLAELPEIIKEAFFIASTGRPGPVVVDLPKDIMMAEGVCKNPGKVSLPRYKIPGAGDAKQIREAAKAIARAERPVLYAGGGVVASGASAELLELAERCQIPVTTTLMGMSCFPGTHRLALGMLGMHGTRAANYAVSDCDCLVALGARFDDRVTGKVDTFAPGATVIHIDIDPAEIGKNVLSQIPINGDVKAVLTELLQHLEPQEHPDWLARIREWQEKYPLRYGGSGSENRIKPQYVVEQIYELTAGKAIIATEVGQNQMWTALYYRFTEPRSFVSSGGLGTMGFGLPAAIGAQIGRPDKIVFDIAGDGSILMNSQELATAVQYRVPVKIAILNNQYLGMVRQWQELFHQRRYSQTDLTSAPDFVKLAEAYGAVGLRVNRPEAVRPALEKALATPGPVVIDFQVEREENVYPMVPPGGSLNAMLGGD